MIDNNVESIKEHLEAIMDILEIPRTESNKNTPLRVAKMWCNELFENRNNRNIEDLDAKMKCFPNNYESEMVIVRDIPFNSICEHHWLPFSGKITVGYIPDKKVIGLSKIPRVVRYFSRQPQLQEKLTTDIGDYLSVILTPRALFIEVEAEHQCVKCRGAESDCSTHTNYKWYCPNSDYDMHQEWYKEFRERM